MRLKCAGRTSSTWDLSGPHLPNDMRDDEVVPHIPKPGSRIAEQDPDFRAACVLHELGTRLFYRLDLRPPIKTSSLCLCRSPSLLLCQRLFTIYALTLASRLLSAKLPKLSPFFLCSKVYHRSYHQTPKMSSARNVIKLADIPTVSQMYKSGYLKNPDIDIEEGCEPEAAVNAKVALIRTSITDLEVASIVNAANTGLLGGGGVVCATSSLGGCCD